MRIEFTVNATLVILIIAFVIIIRAVCLADIIEVQVSSLRYGDKRCHVDLKNNEVEKELTGQSSIPSIALSREQFFNEPNDPCLPALYRDWREFSLYEHNDSESKRLKNIRVFIDRSSFHLRLLATDSSDTVVEIYSSPVGLGDVNTPTPTGRFWINHIYCYPDVVFFDPTSTPIALKYNGFFAPLLVCDGSGRCDRYRDMGIHGFRLPANSDATSYSIDETFGSVSGGCIRLPNPCLFKQELIRIAGLGPRKKNDRGSYHWLNKPVEVLIEGEYPGMNDYPTLVDLLGQSFSKAKTGLLKALDVFSQR
jgi:hypothetical protein